MNKEAISRIRDLAGVAKEIQGINLTDIRVDNIQKKGYETELELRIIFPTGEARYEKFVNKPNAVIDDFKYLLDKTRKPMGLYHKLKKTTGEPVISNRIVLRCRTCHYFNNYKCERAKAVSERYSKEILHVWVDNPDELNSCKYHLYDKGK